MRYALPLPFLLATASPQGLSPGEWATTTAPTGATLNGQALKDLPYSGGAGPGLVCLNPEQAKRPGTMLTNDLDRGCTFSREMVAGGRIDLIGTCPPQAPGLARGTVHILGTYNATRYDLRFATTNPSENGLMGFTGTMNGRRKGDCPIPPPIPVNPAPVPTDSPH